MTRDQFPDSGAAMPEDKDVKGDPSKAEILSLLAKLGAHAVTTPEEMQERIVLVAFQVKSGSQMHAQQILMRELQDLDLVQDTESAGVVCWWIAMDERYDRSDNDSAVFVHMGMQAGVQALVVQAGASGDYNLSLTGEK
jgi:hypothetical protein